jgi:hypothetical protein
MEGQTMKALHIKTDGKVKVLEFTNDTCYKTLSGAVGGLIECVALAKDIDMWVNEEGKVFGLDLNPHATRLFQNTFGFIDPIAGDVIITGGADDEGETLGLSDESIDEITNFLVMVS